jgi:hypothetical protein
MLDKKEFGYILSIPFHKKIKLSEHALSINTQNTNQSLYNNYLSQCPQMNEFDCAGGIKPYK